MFRAFLERLPQNLVLCFRGRYLLWHLLAIALTYLCVVSGFDWFYFEHTRSSTLLSLTLPAAIIGFFIPIIVPVALYVIGEMRKNRYLQKSGTAVAQAGIAAWFISSVYKAFTGRMQPEFYTHLSNLDISREFNFGFFRHGIFWGWPSSHTAVSVACAVALILMYPKKKLLHVTAVVYAAYIAFGVSVSIHWFSDALAGAIIGTVIGIVVAKSFLTQQK